MLFGSKAVIKAKPYLESAPKTDYRPFHNDSMTYPVETDAKGRISGWPKTDFSVVGPHKSVTASAYSNRGDQHDHSNLKSRLHPSLDSENKNYQRVEPYHI
jgi:hypothetical protein